MKFNIKKDKEVIDFTFNTTCGGKILIGITYMDDIRREYHRQKTTELEKKGKKVKIGGCSFRRLIAEESLIYIKDATIQDINSITEPGKAITLDPGEKFTDPIEWDDEMKDWVIGNMHEDFATFIEEATMEVELFQKKALAKEMKNLSDGSAAPLAH